MKGCGSGKTDLELRSLLGCFLFSGDDVDKKIKVLSGGEKARLALAKTIVSKANFLMLDEPTNHLDMHSVELLIEALNKYEGSIVLVSHDRYFISRIANKIWEIEDYKIVEFKGTYSEWEEWKRRREIERKNNAPEIKTETKPVVKEVLKSNDKQQTTDSRNAIDKELKKEYQKQKNRFQQLEEKIAKLNIEKTALESQMASPEIYANKEKFHSTETSYKTICAELMILNNEYEKIFEKIMELEEKMN
jgi:ATP-binding cassette, subfamily F, member 3